MSSSETILMHATCVCLSNRAILLRGAPGSGKSDLALRLIDAGAMLVADDQVALRPVQGCLQASAPAPIAGLLEVRGIGLIRLPYKRHAVVASVVDLVAGEAVARMPDPAHVEVAGVRLPRYTLEPFAASAAVKVRLLGRQQH